MNHIPANIDALSIIEDLNKWGWTDYKIGIVCGFGDGYIDQVRRRCAQKGSAQLTYSRAARLYNFWLDESQSRSRMKNS